MYRLKRASLILFSLILSVMCFGPTVIAAENDVRASLYLDGYWGYVTAGSTKGTVDIDYFVEGKGVSCDSIGVSKIVIYKTDGSYVTTINGSLANGLLQQNVGAVSGTYTYRGTSGATYYAVLTMYASSNGGSDSKPYTTNSVTAP